MNLIPERLIQIRESLGLNKAQAAKMLNMSAMGYGRYEKGERMPSYQVICFMAERFGTTVDYLCGRIDNSTEKTVIVSSAEEPELFAIIDSVRNNDTNLAERLLSYINKLQ